MEVKIKKLNENSVIPKYAKSGDAGLDLTAISKDYDEYGNVVYGTGLSIQIPEGYVGLLFPRSSISKYDISLSNAVGVIDSGYRGEIIFKFKPTVYYGTNRPEIENEPIINYNVGDRVGQLIIIPYPQIEFKEVEELTETERGSGGFGSTNNKENGC